MFKLILIALAAILAVAFAAPKADPSVVSYGTTVVSGAPAVAYSAPVVSTYAAAPVVSSYAAAPLVSSYAAAPVLSSYAASPVVSAYGAYPVSYSGYRYYY